jgi:poly-gamma-glutamate capsule biosynthesis protein CapA/YwtB (metallophosphatase superfamily)/DNA-binding transcriptional ArsR family regulator
MMRTVSTRLAGGSITLAASVTLITVLAGCAGPGSARVAAGFVLDSRVMSDSRGAASAAASVTIAAVGDTMLGDTPDLPPDPGTYLNAVEPLLDQGAGIVFGNLEGTLTTATAGKCGPAAHPSQDCYAFRDPPGYARYLKQAGFTILNDANNHSYDFGAAGRAQTVQAIRAAGMAQTGLPGEITVVRDHGIKVAFVAFAPYGYDANLLEVPAARSLIGRARREAGLVVVYMHAGAEGPAADHVTGREEYYLGEDRGNPEAFAHMAIDAGASLVIASGPHVLRGMQFYKGHLIAYSLGNFAGYGNFATGGDLDLSVVLHVTLSAAGRFESARIYPIRFTGTGRPVPGGAGIAFIATLSSADFGSTAARISPSGVIKAALLAETACGARCLTVATIYDCIIIYLCVNDREIVKVWQDGLMDESVDELAPTAAPQAVRLVEDVDTLRAMADPTRMAILTALTRPGDPVMSVKEIAAELGEPQTKLYRHVRQLLAAGLIRVAATRMVSGILEHQYQTSQHLLKLGPGIMRDHMAETDAAVQMVIDRFYVSLSAAYGESRSKPLFCVSDIRLSPAKADELESKLQDVLDWLSQTPEDPDGEPVGLLLGFYIEEPR